MAGESLDQMYLEQFYLGCLAHASYMLGSGGEAAVVDPQRDVDIYLQAATEHGLRIRYIFETHLHADFVSGHKELAARTGAQIYVAEKAGAAYPHVGVCDGFELQFGTARISVLATPGHTPESICLLITDEEKSRKPFAVLTGDTLFLGDVGRPDLSNNYTPQALAGMLYDSLHNKLLTLSDDVLVYPAHGAGSLCGRNMRADRFSTVGTERLTNYALQIGSREQFIKELTTNLPARPDYFLEDAEINREGAPALADLPALSPVSASQLRDRLAQGAVALDVRSADQFAAGHVPGSVNIALSGQFASWAGTILGLSSHPVLIADSDQQVSEARMRLARVGIEDPVGYLHGGVSAWKDAGLTLAQVEQIKVDSLHQRLQNGGIRVLDVRREAEWQTAHIAEAEFYPLDKFHNALPAIARDQRLAVHCKSGYRSMIACSMLQRAGFHNVMNVVGGFDAWQEAGLPVAVEASGIQV